MNPFLISSLLKQLAGSNEAEAADKSVPIMLPPEAKAPPAPPAPAEVMGPPESLAAKPETPAPGPKVPPPMPMLQGDVYGGDLNDAALKAAQAHQDSATLLANLGKAGSTLGAALSKGQVKPNESFFDDISKQAGNEVTKITQRRALKDAELKREDSMRDLQKKRDMENPGSDISKAYRDFVGKMGYTIPENASAAQLEKLIPNISHYQSLVEGRKQREQMAEESRADRKDRQLQLQTEKLAKELEPAQEVMGKIGQFEGQFGVDLDKFDKKSKKQKDLPGMSVPGVGRVSFYDSDARQLDSMMAAIINPIIKTRAGATVTTPEMERIRTEFQSGKYNTEPEMIDALKRYKAELRSAMKNHEAAFDPEALKRYGSRGGKTSDSYSQEKKAGQAAGQPPHGPIVVQDGVTFRWDPEKQDYVEVK